MPDPVTPMPAIAAGIRVGGAHHSSRLVERQAVLIDVGSCTDAERWVAGRVTALSREGCRLVTAEEELRPDVMVRVMFPGFGAHAAQIDRTDGDGADLRFAPPLHPAIVDYILRMSDPTARG